MDRGPAAGYSRVMQRRRGRLGRRGGTASVLVVLFGTVVGCSDSSDDAAPTAGGAGSGGNAAVDGGAQSGLGDNEGYCEVLSSTPVEWTEQTEAGVPEEVFSGVASGSCEAPFTWDGAGWSMVTIAPASGSGTLHSTLDLDRASARVVTRGPLPDAPPAYQQLCASTYLEVDATVDLALDDATVVEDQPVVISGTASNPPTTISFAVDDSAQGDWISVETDDPSTTSSMQVTMSTSAENCAGEIALQVQQSTGPNSAIGAVQGTFASWSATGCPAGQTAVDPNEAFEGADLEAALATAYDGATVAGQWDDATETELTLSVLPTDHLRCAEPFGAMAEVVMPVNIVATSGDGRLDAVSVAGTARISVAAGAVQQIQLHASADLVCASPTDVLPYSGASCATTDYVTFQLLLNRYLSTPEQDGGGIEIYVYLRDSSAAPGAADRVDALELRF